MVTAHLGREHARGGEKVVDHSVVTDGAASLRVASMDDLKAAHAIDLL